MHTVPTSFKIHDQEVRTDGPVFSAIAIHDTFAASIRAREALLWLQHSLLDIQVRSNSWSFQSLERPDARAASLSEAATADALIIAASETVAVPDQIKGWLDSTFQQQEEGSRAVLVVLHEGDEIPCDDPGPLCSYVERQACLWHTECMCNQIFDEHLDRDYAMQLISMKKSDRRASQPIDALATPSVGQKLFGSIVKAFTSSL